MRVDMLNAKPPRRVCYRKSAIELLKEECIYALFVNCQDQIDEPHKMVNHCGSRMIKSQTNTNLFTLLLIDCCNKPSNQKNSTVNERRSEKEERLFPLRQNKLVAFSMSSPGMLQNAPNQKKQQTPCNWNENKSL